MDANNVLHASKQASTFGPLMLNTYQAESLKSQMGISDIKRYESISGQKSSSTDFRTEPFSRLKNNPLTPYPPGVPLES